MPSPSCCDRLTLRVVLLKVSPLVARLISVPDEFSLEELHDVLQLVFGWSGQAFYSFRIHGQEIGRRRHLRTQLLGEFQLRRREKFLYTYDFLDLWEWDGTLGRLHHALFLATREQADKEASPTAAIIDSQSVKGAEKGGRGSTRRAMTRGRKSKERSDISWSTRWASR